MTKRRVQELCDAYFRFCDENGRFYTLSGLMVALGADKETWERWRSRKELRPVLELAAAKVQDGLEQRSDRMALSLISRPPYGGETGEGGKTLRVVFGDGGSVEDYGG